MPLKIIKCRFGKIVIDRCIEISPVRNGKRMIELFPREYFDVSESNFTGIINLIDFGNDLGKRHELAEPKPFQLAIARFEGSVCNQEILSWIQEKDMLDKTVPEEDILWTMSHYGSPGINGENILYNQPYLHNLFVFSNIKEACHKFILSNHSPVKDRIRWYVFRDDAYDNAYHLSTERLFFPIKRSALSS